MPEVKFGALLAVVALGIVASGCSSSSDNDPNYKTEVTLTPEQQAAEKANMAGQSAPGAAPGQGAAPASAPMPAGKGKR